MQLVMWIVGVLTGLAIYKFSLLIKEKRLLFKWYHWLVLVLLYLFGIFVIGFVGTSFAEGEPQAAGMSTLVFGGVFIILVLLLHRFFFAKKYINKVEENGVIQ